VNKISRSPGSGSHVFADRHIGRRRCPYIDRRSQRDQAAVKTMVDAGQASTWRRGSGPRAIATAPGFGAAQRQTEKVCLPGGLSATSALTGRQDTLRIDLTLEAIVRGLTGGRRTRRTIFGVRPRSVRGDLRAQPTLRRCQLV
jgi:hypothetical protein